ncbi:MAG: hypothetical protein ABH950_02720 [Candidatus Altiarchaeota archaeon]
MAPIKWGDVLGDDRDRQKDYPPEYLPPKESGAPTLEEQERITQRQGIVDFLVSIENNPGLNRELKLKDPEPPLPDGSQFDARLRFRINDDKDVPFYEFRLDPAGIGEIRMDILDLRRIDAGEDVSRLPHRSFAEAVTDPALPGPKLTVDGLKKMFNAAFSKKGISLLEYMSKRQ